MSNDCARAGRWIGRCNFEARYDETPAEHVSEVVAEINRASDEAVREIIRGNISRIYVRDVCVTCGKTIERSKD
jgi:hypothetical protein